jgi:hypothetical protein
MTQLARIAFIYKLLEQNPQTIEEIHNQLLAADIPIGQRQIYLDLNQMKLNYLRPNESLKIDAGRYNKKLFRLIKASENIELNYQDITTFQLTRTSAPRIINIGRASSMNKFKNVYKSFINKNQTLYTFLNEEQNQRTNFFEALYDDKFNKTLDDCIWSVANEKIMILSEVTGDATSANHLYSYPLSFKPIQIIFHRGDYVVAGYEKEGLTLIVLNISKIVRYELTKFSFSNKKLMKLCKEEMNKRFGVTTNIDKNTYKIRVEFSSYTGAFVSNYFWHSSQQFFKLNNGNLILELNCGINRELIGWLFLWMGNVKILSPLILKKIYIDQLALIQDNYKLEGSLKYRNIFSE